MCEHDRQAVYECIFKLRFDMDCGPEYTLENTIIWLEDLSDKELIDELFELLKPYMD